MKISEKLILGVVIAVSFLLTVGGVSVRASWMHALDESKVSFTSSPIGSLKTSKLDEELEELRRIVNPAEMEEKFKVGVQLGLYDSDDDVNTIKTKLAGLERKANKFDLVLLKGYQVVSQIPSREEFEKLEKEEEEKVGKIYTQKDIDALKLKYKGKVQTLKNEIATAEKGLQEANVNVAHAQALTEAIINNSGIKLHEKWMDFYFKSNLMSKALTNRERTLEEEKNKLKKVCGAILAELQAEVPETRTTTSRSRVS